VNGWTLSLGDGREAETQWARRTNGPKRGLWWRYRASVETVMREIYEVAGRRQPTKQVICNNIEHRIIKIFYKISFFTSFQFVSFMYLLILSTIW